MQTKPVNSRESRLQRLLGGTELLRLRERLRRHFERADDGVAVADMVELTQLSAAEREALALLTGRSPRNTRSVRIDIAQLDLALRDAGVADSLRLALETIDGPIMSRKAIEAGIRSEWAWILTLNYRHDGLRGWLQAPAALGRLKRLSKQKPETARRLLDRADTVLQRLPANGTARSQLAAETLGNAHALDNTEPTAAIVVSAWRYMENAAARPNGQRSMNGYGDDAPQTNERIRDIWARAGVLVNELARPALFLNVPVSDTIKGTPGEPTYASLRELVRTPPAWDVHGKTVFVCENPNLVAIVADRLGHASAPMVCTDGMPAAAQRTLLTQLAQAGAQLTYHGDFDWPGLHIGNQMVQIWEVRPWRFSARDYEASVKNAAPLRHQLGGTMIRACWDEALAPAMQHHNIAIAEEVVVAELLEDLNQGRRGRAR